MAPKPRLLDQVRERLRLKYYHPHRQAYLDWIKRYIVFHGKRRPVSMAKEEVEVFLTVERKVAASTQNQALSAILLYKKVLGSGA